MVRTIQVGNKEVNEQTGYSRKCIHHMIKDLPCMRGRRITAEAVDVLKEALEDLTVDMLTTADENRKKAGRNQVLKRDLPPPPRRT